MSNAITDIMQLAFSAGARHDYCDRPACRRAGYCVPPRDPARQNFWACPFEPYAVWEQRSAAAEKLAERLAAGIDARRARRGQPPLFAPAAQPGARDHLDLSKPLDFEALLLKPAPFPPQRVCR